MTLHLERHRHVHFVGIGGIGMSALARILLERGFIVSGSDQAANEQTAALSALGATIHIGHGPELSEGADLVVTTPAAGSAPDVAAAKARGTTIVRRAELLGAIANPHRTVAVAGTHGKSTTSGLIAHIAVEAGLDPTALVGGVVASLGSNARIGSSDLVVVEADEFDAAFLELHPLVGVITSLEPEHLDFFRTAERMYEAFRQFAVQVRDTLVLCADDVPADVLIKDSAPRVVTYGIDRGDWRASDVEERNGCTYFTVTHGGRTWRNSTTLAGLHNVRNALAALIVADLLGVPPDGAAAALASFRGIARRFEVKGEVEGVLVMDDYAHHPTEIRTTLAAIRSRYGRPIRLIFQPHTYSRTKTLLHLFATAFQDASSVYVMDVYAAREPDTFGVSAADVARVASSNHLNVHYTGTPERTLQSLRRDVRPGDVIVTMGAGDVYRLGPSILLQEQSS